jgi:hypothetical protein
VRQVFTTTNSQLDSLKHLSGSSQLPIVKKKNSSDFDFYLNEYLNEESKEWEYPVLRPKHGRFWYNSYEDVE